MAPRRLKRNLNYLKFLSQAKKPEQRHILENATDDLLLCLCECCDNLLIGNVPVKTEVLEKLKRYKTCVRQLADRQLNLENKRKLLINQSGGFLPLLLAPVLTIAAQLLADSLISKK